jgi:hypothetical protein
MRLYIKPHEFALLKLQKSGVLADDSCDEDDAGGNEIYDSLILEKNVVNVSKGLLYDGDAFKQLISSLNYPLSTVDKNLIHGILHIKKLDAGESNIIIDAKSNCNLSELYLD